MATTDLCNENPDILPCQQQMTRNSYFLSGPLWPVCYGFFFSTYIAVHLSCSNMFCTTEPYKITASDQNANAGPKINLILYFLSKKFGYLSSFVLVCLKLHMQKMVYSGSLTYFNMSVCKNTNHTVQQC